MTADGDEPCVEFLGDREDLPERIARCADRVYFHSLPGEQSGRLGEEPPLLRSLGFAQGHEPRADGLRRNHVENRESAAASGEDRCLGKRPLGFWRAVVRDEHCSAAVSHQRRWKGTLERITRGSKRSSLLR